MNAEEFLARGQTTKQQSKLAPFRSDLLKLQRANLTLERMIEFLRLNNVSQLVASFHADFVERDRTSQRRESVLGMARRECGDMFRYAKMKVSTGRARSATLSRAPTMLRQAWREVSFGSSAAD